VGTSVVTRGDVCWMERPSEKGRPVVVITRDGANAVLRRVVVAPITTTLRSAPSQLALGEAEGLYADSVANFDSLMTVPKSYLTRRMGSLGPRLDEMCATLKAMADC